MRKHALMESHVMFMSNFGLPDSATGQDAIFASSGRRTHWHTGNSEAAGPYRVVAP